MNLQLIFLTALSLLVLLLLWFVSKLSAGQKSKRGEGQKGPVLATEEFLKSLDQSTLLVQEAQQRAKQILLANEVLAHELTAKYKAQEEVIENFYKRELEKISHEVGEKINQKIQEADTTYSTYLNSLRDKTTAKLESKESEIEQKIDELFRLVQEKSNKLLNNLETQTSAINLPFENIKKEVMDKVSLLETGYAEFIQQLETKVASGFEQNQKSLSEIENRLNQRSLEAENNYATFVKSLDDQLNRDFQHQEKVLEDKTGEFFNRTQELLTNFIAKLQSRTETQLDQEIGNAKKLIEQYRQQRLEVIDADIVGILEKTLNITLGKKLTLNEQTQLIYEALEEAKKEKFFS